MTSPTSYAPGELVLCRFPFTSGSHTKIRPGVVLLDTGDDDLVVTRVTTQTAPTAFDVALADWPGAGLISPSVVRLHKIATIAKTQVIRRLGHLRPADRQAVAAVLRQTFANW